MSDDILNESIYQLGILTKCDFYNIHMLMSRLAKIANLKIDESKLYSQLI